MTISDPDTMTPLAYADALLADLSVYLGVRTPDMAWSQMGSPVVTCESLAVGVTGLSDRELVPGVQSCGFVTVVSLIIVLGRMCVVENSSTGETEPEPARPGWEAMDEDGTALRTWSTNFPPIDGGLTDTNVTWLVEGGLGYSILTFSTTLGAGCAAS